MTATRSSSCTCFRLRRAARQVSQVYDRELAAVDLSLNEYSILRHAQSGPRMLGELADALGMERTTLTRNLRPLLEAGWLQQAHGEDARQRVVSITPRGIKRVESAKPHWQRAQARIESSFGKDATARLRDDLDLLVGALHGSEGAPA
jgi:DNA-binding MarR family transcriptional regulator